MHTWRNRGFSLVEVVVALGVLSVMSMTMAGFLTQSLRASKSMEIKSTLQNLRAQIFAVLHNNSSFENLVRVNVAAPPAPSDATLSGVLDTTILAPVPEQYRNLSVVMQTNGQPSSYTTDWVNNNVLIDTNSNNSVSGTSATRGYTLAGTKCTTFNQAIGNDACPIRIVAEWKASCSTPYPCLAFAVFVRVTFSYRPGPSSQSGQTPLNISAFNISETMIWGESYLADQCLQNLGIWDGTQCLFNGMTPCGANQRMMGVQRISTPTPHLEPVCVDIFNGAQVAPCPVGEKMVGLNANGTRNCERNIAGANDLTDCPAGQKVVGINDDGTRRCAAALSGVDLNCPIPGEQVTKIANGSFECSPVDEAQECFTTDIDISVYHHAGDWLIFPVVPAGTCAYHYYNDETGAACPRDQGFRLKTASWVTTGQCNTLDPTYMPTLSMDLGRESVTVPGGAPLTGGGGAWTACEQTIPQGCLFPGNPAPPPPYTRTFRIECCRNH